MVYLEASGPTRSWAHSAGNRVHSATTARTNRSWCCSTTDVADGDDTRSGKTVVNTKLIEMYNIVRDIYLGANIE